jgi:hypothetical protein
MQVTRGNAQNAPYHAGGQADGSAVLVAFAIVPFPLFLLGYGVLWTTRGFRPTT